jgi:heme a synthase
MNKNCQRQYHPWLHYFALVTAIVTFLLIGLGGLVTSHEAGMSVPDWPNTYGYNMFLFPISKWVGGVFYEHTHRLLASTVGLLTVILAVWISLRDPRPWLRQLGWVAVVLVIVQGILGGLRVKWNMAGLGVFHGTVAQIFLVLMFAVALWTSRWWWQLTQAENLVTVSDRVRRHVLYATILIFLQLMLGATMRHQHAGLAIHDFPLAYGQLWPDTSAEALARYNAERVEVVTETPVTAFQIELQMFHRLGAVIIFLAVLACVWQTRRELGGGDALTRLAAGWLVLIFLQIGLGIETLHSNKAADIATLHVMIGALSLVTGALGCVIAFQRAASAPKLAVNTVISGGLPSPVSLAVNK